MLDTLWYLMLLFYVPACFGLIIIVLLQKGKGVGFAGAFGIGGGSDTVFGPRASKSLPQRLTYVAAALFMILAFAMSLISGKLGKGEAPDMEPESGVMSAADFETLEGLGSGLDENEIPQADDVADEAPAPAAAPAEETPASETAPAAAPEDPPAPAEDAPQETEAPASPS